MRSISRHLVLAFGFLAILAGTCLVLIGAYADLMLHTDPPDNFGRVGWRPASGYLLTYFLGPSLVLLGGYFASLHVRIGDQNGSR